MLGAASQATPVAAREEPRDVGGLGGVLEGELPADRTSQYQLKIELKLVIHLPSLPTNAKEIAANLWGGPRSSLTINL